MSASACPITASAAHESVRERERLLAFLRFEREQGFCEFAQEFIDGCRDIVLEMQDVEDLDQVSEERAELQTNMEHAVCEAMLLALAGLGMGKAVEKILEGFAMQRRELAAARDMPGDVPFVGHERVALAAEYNASLSARRAERHEVAEVVAELEERP